MGPGLVSSTMGFGGGATKSGLAAAPTHHMKAHNSSRLVKRAARSSVAGTVAVTCDVGTHSATRVADARGEASEVASIEGALPSITQWGALLGPVAGDRDFARHAEQTRHATAARRADGPVWRYHATGTRLTAASKALSAQRESHLGPAGGHRRLLPSVAICWLEASRSPDQDLDEWIQRIKVPTLTRSIGSKMSRGTPTPRSAAWIPILFAMLGSCATCVLTRSIVQTSSTVIAARRYFLPRSSRTGHPRVPCCDAALACPYSQYCATGLKPADDQTGDVNRLVRYDLERISDTFQRSSHLVDAACARSCFQCSFTTYLWFAACRSHVRLWLCCRCKHALSIIVFFSSNDNAPGCVFPPKVCVVDSRSAS